MNKSNQQNAANNAERSTDQMHKSETKSGMKDQAKPVIAKNAAHAPAQAATKNNAASMNKEKQS